MWHAWLRSPSAEGLDEVLHEDCVFYSPIVFTAQEGRDVTALYLQAAAGSLAGGGTADDGNGSGDGSGFRYVKEIVSGTQAALEFETTVEGKYVNGIDIITCDDDGMITEFKVLIRPLQAINLVHEQMRRMLESMQG
ncbi:MAG: nuclear transport factor 2 family protein [Actinomycetia bacterium]|nr:nuclear transport factor 2 family protein [Actinomycetes bacterium]